MPIFDDGLYQVGLAMAACPTAPCHEGHVLKAILAGLEDLPHVTTKLDEFGNLHAHYRYASGDRAPFRLVAHMDHPGFVVHRTQNSEQLHFAGGVNESYFAGKKIVFYSEAGLEPLGRAIIESIDFSGKTKRVLIDRPIPAKATFATWALPKARCTESLFVSPACDDLVQVSTIVALLRRLGRSRARADVHALFTRAEEIGFAGALASLTSRERLAPVPTFSLEISQARGFAKVGAGPVVRVGDRLSIFDSLLTHWMEIAFSELQLSKPSTVYQRLLMGGGTCEASVFQRAGLPTGALCIAVNNFHNMAAGTKIALESISLNDWQGLYDFLFFLATEARSPQTADHALTLRFAQLEQKALTALTRAL